MTTHVTTVGKGRRRFAASDRWAAFIVILVASAHTAAAGVMG
ncbi:MAG: hypothetical protein O3A53_13630 [Acidobacteria bacterium]|nr:hypothetical protein [Acidobacteriota bacterium]MDA1235826.1 hypothetical protein [Acidobacteriota bacterium]